MLLPCRFCTRMSLICPINSSRSNQSSQPRPAIWSRTESRLDPGSIAHKAPLGGGGGGGCCSGREPSIVQPGSLEPRRPGHAQADINGRDPLHQRTWPRLTAASSGAERATTRGGEEESRAEERPSGEQLQHLVGISEGFLHINLGKAPAAPPGELDSDREQLQEVFQASAWRTTQGRSGELVYIHLRLQIAAQLGHQSCSVGGIDAWNTHTFHHVYAREHHHPFTPELPHIKEENWPPDVCSFLQVFGSTSGALPKSEGVNSFDVEETSAQLQFLFNFRCFSREKSNRSSPEAPEGP
ncbi:hypothetical protein D4764_16G0000290 [Takifugu flavidus]|uniref:Uncharacterized protein n=1 Tax=Takifugu flavidus TaxID=433684 RepID=A0A5C6NVK0_9TELE|nr:hypothetical protein D4764_16G0000290 [Takifugu flavidus]